MSGSHVGHVRPDFTEALIKHGKLEAVDGYALFSKRLVMYKVIKLKEKK